MTIRDAIHGDIVIADDLILNVIHTKEFQRLRKIKQLGLTYMVFPSANHTRFSHSIGVYFIATKVIKRLKEINCTFSSIDEKSFLIAALLHDLGHGPMSHTAEYLFNYTHEDYSVDIIKNNNTEIHKILSKYDKEIISKVCKIISKEDKKNIFVRLLSSSVDIDRMDYLLRDSQVTGVVYGNIEIDRLIGSIIVKNDKLYFDKGSVNLIEDFLIARYQMFSQVYLNKKSLVYEQLVSEILVSIKKLYEQNFEFKTDISLIIPFFKDEEISVCDYIQVNDDIFSSIIEQLAVEEDTNLVSLVNSYLRSYPVTFDNKNKEVYTFHVDKLEKDKIYGDPIYLLDKENNVFELSELSQLMKFAKEELKITIEGYDGYIKKM